MMDDLICFANDRIVERFLANETLGQICWGFQGFPFFKMKTLGKISPSSSRLCSVSISFLELYKQSWDSEVNKHEDKITQRLAEQESVTWYY